MVKKRETASASRESFKVQACVCGLCGYERIGLDEDALCPECGELVIRPAGMVASFRHAWRTSTSWTLQAIWVIACISAFAAALVSIGLIIVFVMVILDRSDGWNLFLPSFGWIFVVVPAGLFAVFCALASLNADDRRLAGFGAALSVVSILTPPLVLLVLVFIARAVD